MAEADTSASITRNKLSAAFTGGDTNSIFQSCLYDVSVPKTSEGLMLQVCSSPFLGYDATFTGYRRHTDGQKPYVETNHILRNIGDIITGVEGLDMFGKSFDYVVKAIGDKCKDQHSVSLRMLDKILFDVISRQKLASAPDKEVQKSQAVTTKTKKGGKKSPTVAKEKTKTVTKVTKSSQAKQKSVNIGTSSPLTRSMAREIVTTATASATKNTPKEKLPRKKTIVKHIVKAVQKIARVATRQTMKTRHRNENAPNKYLVIHPKTGSQFMFHLPENIRTNVSRRRSPTSGEE